MKVIIKSNTIIKMLWTISKVFIIAMLSPSIWPITKSSRIEHVCSQPLESGNCYARIRRWGYNNGRCRRFTYGGCGGNDNNFESKKECEKKCTVDERCELQICTLDYNPICGSNGVTYGNSCQFNLAQLCHNPLLTIDHYSSCDDQICISRICTLQYSPVCGSDGNTYSNECFFNLAKRCDNPQLTIAEYSSCDSCQDIQCDIPICPPLHVIDYDGPGCCPGCKLDCSAVLCLQPVCLPGSQPIRPEGSCCSVCSDTVGSCPDGNMVYCFVRPCMFATCPQYPNAECGDDYCGGCFARWTVKGNPIDCETPICELPLTHGPCRGFFRRWGYNSQTEECEEFTYGGCGGNANNYETRKECEKACDSVCSQPLESGNCYARIGRWGYKHGRCRRFTYGGCGGNDNNFESKKECEKKCTAEKKNCDKMCSEIYRPICGSDGETYHNACEFRKGRCMNSRLIIESKGECPNEKTPEECTDCALVDVICPHGGPRYQQCDCKPLDVCCDDCCGGKRCVRRIEDSCQDIQCDIPICPPLHVIDYDGPGCCPGCKLDCSAVLCLQPVCLPGSQPIRPEGSCCSVCSDTVGTDTCPDGSDIVYCKAAPCQFNTCDTYPSATCINNYCGGCFADWYLNGQYVDCAPLCELPISPGECKGYFPKWGYDSNTETCVEFIHGGCGGNFNIFSTLDECNATCGSDTETCQDGSDIFVCIATPCQFATCDTYPSATCINNNCGACFADWYLNGQLVDCDCPADTVPVQCLVAPCQNATCAAYPDAKCFDNYCGECSVDWYLDNQLVDCDVCSQPLESGNCYARIGRWGYKNGRCRRFTYGGCGGNDNNFESKKECEKKCTVCELPLVIGPCEAAIPRWGFVDGECVQFLYGGCDGNSNNFETEAECNDACGPN